MDVNLRCKSPAPARNDETIKIMFNNLSILIQNTYNNVNSGVQGGTLQIHRKLFSLTSTVLNADENEE